MHLRTLSIVIFWLVLLSQYSFAQNDSIIGVKLIDYYLINNDIDNADATLKKQINSFNANNLVDSLIAYPYYVGKVALAKTYKANAIEEAEQFVYNILDYNTNKSINYKMLISLADFYDEVSENKKSLDVTLKALDIASKIKDLKGDAIGKIRYNIGASYLSLGQIEEAKSYFKKALYDYKTYKNTDPRSLSDANNAVGATMWMSSKLDSAKFYYNQAIKSIDFAKKGDPYENLYLKNVIKSNVSLLEYSQGDFTNAIKTQTTVINDYEKVANNCLDENIVSKAKRYQARAISNLAVFYNESGNLVRANEILVYSLNKKKQMQNTASDIATTLIQIGQSQLSLQNYDKAITYLNDGLNTLEKISEDNTYWKAAAFHAIAEAYTAKKNKDSAKQYYKLAEESFIKALGNEYDKEFLGFLSNKALFLAKNNAPKKAAETALKAYNYILDNNDEDQFQLFKKILNLSEVYLITENTDKAKYWIKQGYNYLNKKAQKNKSQLLQFDKSKLILLNVKCNYQATDNKDVKFLEAEINKLDEALDLLEKRKETVFAPDDIDAILLDYRSITNFSKKLNLELYEITKNPNALKKLIELHESSIYQRIRTRLNMQNNLAFTNVPDTILKKEKKLKDAISNSLNDNNNFEAFVEANTKWDDFLALLKKDHAKYYDMRYATIEASLDNLKKNIPDNTTIVRYLYIENDLHALIIAKSEVNIFKLNSENIDKSIATLSNTFEFEKVSHTLYNLYQKLWQPFANKITTKKILIIPDGELFNLSFETLTTKHVNSYTSLAKNCLLSKHTIAYNYSLELLDVNKKVLEYTNDFVAFAPEFNSKMKTDYKITITDSLNIDESYLKLLPQPFTVDIAKEYSRLFKGKYFINENASKNVFTTEAKEHKIIHIGTHAESNNVSPELSRLIFAKNLNDELTTVDNYLYTYEIYNQNLASNLAILTACETGKPTFQPGEGMISLAHAFNYAGSESILTSLWKIDEQSSAKIIENFYSHLKTGLSKDEALQKAKLDYLSTAKGRTLSPQYWAGLVLIGDTNPIDLQPSNLWWIWSILVLMVILALFFFVNNKIATGRRLRKSK